jgi:hypothetical protein
MLEKSSKMSAREAMIALAGSPPMHGELPRWLAKVAKLAAFRSERRARFGTKKSRTLTTSASRLYANNAQIEEAQRDAKVVANFFNSRAQALANIDPDFHRGDIDAFLAAARAVSGGDSA